MAQALEEFRQVVGREEGEERETPKVLQGIRLIEWGMFHNGPAAGYMLGDLGAEVIKIEHPIRGDAARGMESIFGTSTSLPGGRNIIFETSNRNKKSITLDLSQEQGRKVLYRLVEKADVFYTNFRPSVARKLGADYETLRSYNPLLIYAIASGYGTAGPEAEKRAFDPIAMARSGMMWGVGDKDQQGPGYIVGGIFDQMGATTLAYGILAALVARERWGIGQMVEASLLSGAIHLQAIQVNALLLRGRALSRQSRRRARNPLANHYKCQDGKWLLLAEVQADRYWSEFCQALGLAELEKDPRFASALARRESCQELITILDQVFATRTRDEWLRIFQERSCGFAYTPINEVEDLVSDPQVRANDYIVDFPHPVLGPTRLVGFPVKFSATPAKIQSEAPEFGQHTEEVLMDICGYTWDEISELRTAGAV